DLYDLHAVVSRSATSAQAVAERIGARYGTTDIGLLLADDDIDVVVIATRHDSHAQLALAALKSGKHVFVEKPLALLEEDLVAFEHFYANTPNAPILMTGFNRRFSPPLQALQGAIKHRRAPLMANYRMNAGYLPPEHWVHGAQGGGRNLGEACHIYDVFAFLTGARSARVEATSIDPPDRHLRRDDNFVASIRYQDGSVCALTYTALGAGGYPKERMEVFCDGRVYSLDDYHSLETVGSKEPAWHTKRQDKGHLSELRALHTGIRDNAWPISLGDQLDASRVGLRVQRALFGNNPNVQQDPA
ncbi:MAG: Gfo/Idh/MocA family protein, partial [Burkholderiales bacterium]